MKSSASIILLFLIQTNCFCQQNTEFIQETQQAFPLGIAGVDSNVRSVAVDSGGKVFIATGTGVYVKYNETTKWEKIGFKIEDEGPAFVVRADRKGGIWIGNWKGAYRMEGDKPVFVPGTEGPISVLCDAKAGIYALGPGGVFLFDKEHFTKKNWEVARSVRAAVSDNEGGLWIASDVGLYHAVSKKVDYYYKTNILISAGLRGLVIDPSGNLWAAGLGGISVLNNAKRVRSIGTKEGCPSIYLNCLVYSADGMVWAGTRCGVARFSLSGKHTLLFSRRWLPDDQVNDIAFDRLGDAWIATGKGVSVIRKKKMILAEKEEYFYAVLMRRHIREPWIAGQCHLSIQGDTSSWQAEDDDNDGEYTGNYLAMESFRYAVTHSEDARIKASKAFHFLKQLQDITGGDGYFARTIVPAEWKDRVHDGNRSFTKQELTEEGVNEPRFKPVEIRWHLSGDGKWYCKGDASSDEWCGHMMGYYFYYELAANQEEKEIMRQHVSLLLDHLITHDFNMTDPDGKHTRWSVWSPNLLNHDPEWKPDQAQNSMELLAFLKFGYYITGNEKYQRHYLRLINQDHYLLNMENILHQNPAWFIYFDVTLQVYLFPILLKCEKDTALLKFYQKLADQWMQMRIHDQNPQIDFLYSYARGRLTGTNESVEFLKNTPLDLVDWTIDHTKREDVRIVHVPVLDDLEVSELQPASIRSTVRWDKNPWAAVSGDPQTEREPVFWLFPYWLGRYLGAIK